MKVSKLISDLSILQKEYGDIRVDVCLGGWQDHAGSVYYVEKWVHETEDGEIEADVECIVIDTE